jgi:hypothetical protein
MTENVALIEQRIAHRTESLEALAENVRLLRLLYAHKAGPDHRLGVLRARARHAARTAGLVPTTEVWPRPGLRVPPEIKSWRIGPRPILPAPCTCEHPHYFRDEVGVRCLLCAKRRALRAERGLAHA